MKRIVTTAAALLTSLGLGLAALPPAQSMQTKPAPHAARFGELSIRNYAQFNIRFGAGPNTAELTGPKLLISTPKYDMAAPHITLEQRKGGTPARYKLTHALATGGVRIVERDAVANRTTTMTCERAEYHATLAPDDRGHIDLSGNVRSVTQDPDLAEPLIQESESGTVTFLSGGVTEIALRNGSVSGTPVEPPARNKK